MKVVFAAMMLWILVRQNFGTYLGFATKDNPNPETASTK